MPRKIARCGTQSGYNRHRRLKEMACEACLKANREATASRRVPVPVLLKPCGTVAAYRRHLRHGEDPCAPCRRASAEEREAERRRGRREAVA